ncbi:MAG: hypothetical protein P8Z00_16540, partial [Anaerolineales bacterium]
MRSRVFTRHRLVLVGDLFLIIVAALGSFALRLDLGPFFIDYLNQAIWLSAIALLLKPLVFYAFGLYRRLWAYASIYELLLIILAVSTASVLVSVTVILLLVFKVLPNFPRGVLPIDWLLSMGLIGGSRFALRVLAETQSSASNSAARSHRVLVVGAGDAGALVVREMQKNPDLPLRPVCFLDDDPDKQKQQIHGIPVMGTLADLARTVDIRRIDEVIIAIPRAPGRQVCPSPGFHEFAASAGQDRHQGN